MKSDRRISESIVAGRTKRGRRESVGRPSGAGRPRVRRSFRSQRGSKRLRLPLDRLHDQDEAPRGSVAWCSQCEHGESCLTCASFCGRGRCPCWARRLGRHSPLGATRSTTRCGRGKIRDVPRSANYSLRTAVCEKVGYVFASSAKRVALDESDRICVR